MRCEELVARDPVLLGGFVPVNWLPLEGREVFELFEDILSDSRISFKEAGMMCSYDEEYEVEEYKREAVSVLATGIYLVDRPMAAKT